MSWARIDDRLRDHPKVMHLGKLRYAAMGVWLDALCYASEHLTDGRLPGGLVDLYPPQLVQALVEVGLWKRVDGALVIHDYLAFNPSREKVLAERDSAKVRAKYGRSSGESRPKFASDSGAPSRPLPDPSESVVVEGDLLAREGAPHRISPPVAAVSSLPEFPAISWLSSQKVHLVPNGDGVHRLLGRLVEMHGVDTVLEAFGDIQAEGQARTAAQYVFGADNILNPIRSIGRKREDRGHTRPVAEVSDAFTR